MATRLPRSLQSIFGATAAATPANVMAQPGSTAAGSPVYTGSPATIQGNAAWLQGLFATLVQTGGGVNSQAWQEMNAILFLITQQLEYILQTGMPEWIAGENYFVNDLVQCAPAGPGPTNLYVSLQNNNTGNNPIGDITGNWAPFIGTASSPNLCKAWVNFVGTGSVGACVINSAFNVASVTKGGTGQYQVAFTNNMTDAKYAINCSAGAANGVTNQGAGTIFVMAYGGAAAQKAVGSFTFFLLQALPSNIPADGESVSIFVFGN